jgi:hypothetical protein
LVKGTDKEIRISLSVFASHAGFIVLLAGPAMTLMGVVLWQGASVA